MKIALVSPYDYSYPGGVSNHISYLDSYFTRWGHSVKVLAPCSNKKNLSENIIPLGKPVPIPTSGSIARIGLSFTLSSRVKALLERERFDVIHLHEPLTPMLPLTVLFFSTSVNVGTFHAYRRTSRGYGWGKILLHWWFQKLHGRIAVSRAALGYVSQHFPASYTIIPNGVDTGHFTPDAQPLPEFCDGKKNILFVGRLEKRKGLKYLLGAYEKVKKEMPDCRLLVVGPGTRLRRGYERTVKAKGLKDVVFLGSVPYDNLPSYYKTCDVFCAPATGFESFGIVLLEAMATGKPVVASAIEGYSDLVSHGGQGLLVPPKDETTLAQALLSLLADKPLCQHMGEQGILHAQGFAWEQVARRVLDYYEDLLEGKTETALSSKKAPAVSL